MTNKEIDDLVEKYWKPINYSFADENFEHRFEPTSSGMMYSLIREYKPTNVVALGTSFGGSTLIITAALLHNKRAYKYLAAEKEEDLRKQTKYHVLQKYHVAPKLIGDLTRYRNYPDEIDFLFHDTNHDRETTEWVFKHIIPKVKKGGLVIFHDWPVDGKSKKWVAKDGAWGETLYMLELKEKGILPLEKVYFNWELGSCLETGVFLKK